MPESELVARAAAGDSAAQNVLVEQYYDDCWRYAFRLLGDEADAEDAVQETFMRAMTALPHYQHRERFRSWVFTILVNQCRNFAMARSRREQRFRLLPHEALENYASASADGSDEELTLAIQQLDPDQREVVLLKFGAGLGYTDIARITGASESALKMRVKRACARMRTFLEGLSR